MPKAGTKINKNNKRLLLLAVKWPFNIIVAILCWISEMLRMLRRYISYSINLEIK